MDVAITRMSSKGQVIIPIEMRKDFDEGDKILIIQNNDQIILKKASKVDENFKEDLEFAKRTEKAYKLYEKGKFVSMKSTDFLKELEKC